MALFPTVEIPRPIFEQCKISVIHFNFELGMHPMMAVAIGGGGG